LDHVSKLEVELLLMQVELGWHPARPLQWPPAVQLATTVKQLLVWAAEQLLANSPAWLSAKFIFLEFSPQHSKYFTFREKLRSISVQEERLQPFGTSKPVHH